MRIDHLVIAVADLEAAASRYSTLLGRMPAWQGSHPAYQTTNVLFDLDPYIELLSAGAQATSPLADWVRAAARGRNERPMMIALAVDDIDAQIRLLRAQDVQVSEPLAGEGVDAASQRRRSWRNAVIDPGSARGLRLLLIEHDAASPALMSPAPHSSSTPGIAAIDHLVIFSADAKAAAAWWIDHCGAVFSSAHEFSERGTVNVLVDLAGVIVELIQPTNNDRPLHADRFWGIAYRVADLEGATTRLRAAGLPIDSPRPGLAPGTRVATLRWDATPSLLIQRRTP